MPKKSHRDVDWIEVVVTFKCPKDHEVAIQFTYPKASGSMKELLDRVYSPLCSQCGWKANLSGHKAVSIGPAQSSRETG
jgi:hypothetical protein